MENPHKLIKKEFITTWSKEPVLSVKPQSPSRERFFDKVSTGTMMRHDIIRPDDISFAELYMFTGFKTKVTIEILPW